MTSDNQTFDIAIIGGGIVGAATAYKIQKAHPSLKIVLFEKEKSLASHQTGRNSGVIHSGLYYKPGSYKAKNCVEGRRELVSFAREYQIDHDVCGKVVVATNENELPFLNKIFDNGIANDTEGIQKIDGDEVREIEPYCETAIAGIWVPCTGIIDFPGVTQKCVDLMVETNPSSNVFLETEVLNISRTESSEIVTNKGTFNARYLVFCGGLQSDRLAKKDNVELDLQIVGFRGDYYELTERAKHKVRNLIYPVPNPAFPFLGVHFTRMVNGDVECGPNAVFTFKREGYGKLSFSLRDTSQALTYSGTWNLLRAHWKFALDEYKRAFSKRLFHKRICGLIPSLKMEDLTPGRSGVRAMALGPEGSMIEDFKIEYKDNSIHVLNAPSPAATSCLAIGEAVRKMADKRFQMSDG